MAIGSEDEVAAGKRADQHEEGGAGKVEVRNQCVYCAKLEAWIDEEAGGGRACANARSLLMDTDGVSVGRREHGGPGQVFVGHFQNVR